MAKFTMYLHRLGAFAANVAQTFLQTYGGGNGDPQALDDGTAARKRGSESAAAPESGGGTASGSGVHRRI